MKNYGTAFLLCLFTGMFGGHRYYLGFYMSGVIYTLTVGLYFFGWILDLLRLKSLVDKANQSIANKSTIKVNSLISSQLSNSQSRQSESVPVQIKAESVYDEIEKLASLKERGILTEEEFQSKKKSLLG